MLARSNNRAAASGSCFDLQLVRVCIQFAKLRSSCSQQSRLPKASRDTLPSPKAKRAVKSTMANGVLTLPRSLERPAAKTTDSEGLRKDFAELNGVPNSFVREMVGEMAESMINGIRFTQVAPPARASDKPSELRAAFYDNGSVPFMAPTHILELSNSAQPSGARKLFLIHQLPFAANCSAFPSLPTSQTAATKSSTAALPVIRASLPSPETFDILQMYLYTKDANALRKVFLPLDWSKNTSSIIERAVKIKGFWSNACALGTVENDEMYDVIDECWSEVLKALEKSTSR